MSAAHDPAPANGAAVTQQARVEAIALAYIKLSHGRHAPEAYEGKKSFWNSHAEFIIAADPVTAQLAALQDQVQFWQNRALTAQAALKALVYDPSFPDISDEGLEATRQALAAQPVEVSDG